MSETIVKLTAQTKDTDKNPRQLRDSGFLPVTIYGKGQDSISAQINTHEFEMAYRNNKDGIFEITLDKNAYKVKVQELQMNYNVGQILNIEFVTV